jgi:hypothetical protein
VPYRLVGKKEKKNRSERTKDKQREERKSGEKEVRKKHL